MKHLALLFLFCAALSLNSCDDSTSTGPDQNGDDKSFAIVSVSEDSVYLGESVIVTLKNAQTKDFSVFVHTVSIPVQSATRNDDGTAILTFNVPENAESGMLRVIEREVEAKGGVSITVLPRDKSTMFPTVDHFAPGRVYTGDLFVVTGTDIPLRESDMEVSIGGVPVEITHWDATRIFTRVPEAVQTGEVRVRMFDQVFSMGFVEKLEHTGQLLEEGTLSGIRFYSARMQGLRRSEMIFNGDTSTTEILGRIDDADFNWRFAQSHQVELVGDSLILVTQEAVGDGTVRLVFRLKLVPESRVSGRVSLEATSQGITSFWTAEVSEMRWIKVDGKYIIQTHSIDLPQELVSYVHGARTADQINSSIYTQAEETSVINIDLTP